MTCAFDEFGKESLSYDFRRFARLLMGGNPASRLWNLGFHSSEAKQNIIGRTSTDDVLSFGG